MRIVRFGTVGALNTLIDFAILNLLLALFAVTGGLPLMVCNATAFLAASLNSYFLNRKWTFAQQDAATLRQFLLFFTLTTGGLLVNTLVLYGLVSGLPQPSGMSNLLWVNVAKVVATAASLIWNYLAYRHVVFGEAKRTGRGTRDDGRGKT